MNIEEYSWDNKKPYHFESSQNYCDIEKIERAKQRVISKRRGNKTAYKQLYAIVELEILRYKLAVKEINLSHYRKLVSSIDIEFFNENDFDVFENTEIHDDFYHYLNEEYR